MNIEYEATFENINKEKMRAALKQAGAELVRPEFEQRRAVFHLPAEKASEHAWLRVRDEGNKVTMSLKIVDGGTIRDQKEILLSIDNFEAARDLLDTIGCKEKAYQVTRRELWRLDGVEITIDEWPFLELCVEVEGASEEDVKKVCEKIGLDYAQALFCAADVLYQRKYGITSDHINNRTPRLDFEMSNPFTKNI